MKRVILLADDSPTIQRLVTQTFAESKVDIVSVSNGDSAIRKFEELHPQLVLADIYMPGKNGYEVCTYIKNHSVLSDTPVVLLAGAFDAFDEEKAKQAGAIAHITKPFEPQALVDLVMGLIPKEDAEPEPEPAPAPVPEPASIPAPAPAVAKEPAPAPVAAAPALALASASAAPAAPVTPNAEGDHDLLGLGDLFQPPAPEAPPAMTVSDEEIERIADRVIQKLSTQVIESVAWDVVPDITTKVLREELKRQS